MTIRIIDEGAMECREADGLRLGFPTGIITRRFGSADTIAIRKSGGFVIGPDEKIEPWPIEKIIENDGEMIALGPWLDGSRPFEAIPVDKNMIYRLIPAIRAIKSAGFPLNGLYSRALRWLPDGGILVFPPKLAALVRELSPEKESFSSWEKWVHPDRQGEQAWSFTLGVLAWHALTGVDPFHEEIGEERRERIRNGTLPPIEALSPGVDEKASLLIRSALTGDGDKIPTLDDWDGLIKTWRQRGIVRDLSAAESDLRRKKALRMLQSGEQRLKTRRWFRKSGWKFIAAAAISAAVLAFFSAPLRKALETPVTAGLTPLEVAEVYYQAINSMDSSLMNDCLAKRTGKDDVRIVDTVFVTTKVRQGYEGTAEPPLASDWIRDGKPELPDGIWPWGISNLELTELGDGRIQASYLFWTPPEGGAESAGLQWYHSRTDILSFTEARRSWEISLIERSTAD